MLALSRPSRKKSVGGGESGLGRAALEESMVQHEAFQFLVRRREQQRERARGSQRERSDSPLSCESLSLGQDQVSPPAKRRGSLSPYLVGPGTPPPIPAPAAPHLPALPAQVDSNKNTNLVKHLKKGFARQSNIEPSKPFNRFKPVSVHSLLSPPVCPATGRHRPAQDQQQLDPLKVRPRCRLPHVSPTLAPLNPNFADQRGIPRTRDSDRDLAAGNLNKSIYQFIINCIRSWYI